MVLRVLLQNISCLEVLELAYSRRFRVHATWFRV